MFRTTLWASMVAVILASAGRTSAAEPYTVTDLGGEYVYAMGLNENHEVVGYVKPGGTWDEAYAFLWTADTGLTSIGGYMARDINDIGQIAGSAATLRAGVWENGAWVTLWGRQNAYAINNQGQVTGLISAQPSIPGPYAPYRDDDIYSHGFIELVRPYPRASHGFDINNHGEVVADCGTLDALYVGVFYAADESYLILDNDGNYDAHARSINDLGQIVGDSRVSRDDDRRAVYWESPTSPMEYMGALGPGMCVAYAINESAEAVGISSDRAFVWNRNDGMLDLNALIDVDADIVLTRATDISDNGAIVSWGFDAAGRECSFLLTPATVAVEADVDIVPRTLNRHSRGRWITARIRLPVDFDVVDVDPDSLRLGDQVEPDRIHVDEGQQVVMAKFPRAEVMEVIQGVGDVELTVAGALFDGTEFAGTSTIRVIGNRSNSAASRSGLQRHSKDD